MVVLKAGVSVNPSVPQDPTAPQKLKVQVVVNDADVRAQAGGFDGMEDVFVMVPRDVNGGTEWEARRLQFRMTYSAGHGQTKTLDVHEAELDNIDLNAVARDGIAVGLDTNVGTLWAQEVAKNTRVAVPRTPPTPPAGLSVQASMSDTGASSLRVQVSVEDVVLAAEHAGYDGLEKVFALVPRFDQGKVVWDEQPLTWVTQLSVGRQPTKHLDIHELTAANPDTAALAAYGVAVGVRTSVGVIWAQEPGRNYPVAGV